MTSALDDLVLSFQGQTLPKADWTHGAHLAVGLWHVARFGPGEALDRLRTGIRRLNEAHGVVNSDTSGYHETITRAYVILLSQWREAHQLERTDDLVAPLRASAIAAPDVLLHFYSREHLFSPRARAEWVEPDRLPLQLAALTRG